MPVDAAAGAPSHEPAPLYVKLRLAAKRLLHRLQHHLACGDLQRGGRRAATASKPPSERPSMVFRNHMCAGATRGLMRAAQHARWHVWCRFLNARIKAHQLRQQPRVAARDLPCVQGLYMGPVPCVSQRAQQPGKPGAACGTQHAVQHHTLARSLGGSLKGEMENRRGFTSKVSSGVKGLRSGGINLFQLVQCGLVQRY
jgi:hypothetical protein